MEFKINSTQEGFSREEMHALVFDIVDILDDVLNSTANDVLARENSIEKLIELLIANPQYSNVNSLHLKLCVQFILRELSRINYITSMRLKLKIIDLE